MAKGAHFPVTKMEITFFMLTSPQNGGIEIGFAHLPILDGFDANFSIVFNIMNKKMKSHHTTVSTLSLAMILVFQEK